MIDSPKAIDINTDHSEKDHILNKFFDSSDVFEHRSHVTCYRGKSNSLPAIFHSHAWKSSMDRKSIPFQFNKFDDRCSESSMGINKGTSDDSASEMEDVILDFESIRSSGADANENNSNMFCNCLPRLGMGGKMYFQMEIINIRERLGSDSQISKRGKIIKEEKMFDQILSITDFDTTTEFRPRLYSESYLNKMRIKKCGQEKQVAGIEILTTELARTRSDEHIKRRNDDTSNTQETHNMMPFRPRVGSESQRFRHKRCTQETNETAPFRPRLGSENQRLKKTCTKEPNDMVLFRPRAGSESHRLKNKSCTLEQNDTVPFRPRVGSDSQRLKHKSCTLETNDTIPFRPRVGSDCQRFKNTRCTNEKDDVVPFRPRAGSESQRFKQTSCQQEIDDIGPFRNRLGSESLVSKMKYKIKDRKQVGRVNQVVESENLAKCRPRLGSDPIVSKCRRKGRKRNGSESSATSNSLKDSSTGSPDEQNGSSKADGINISKVVVSGVNLRVPEINITDADTHDICQQQETSLNWKTIDNKLLADVGKVQDLDDMQFRPRLGSESMVSKLKNRARARTRKSEDTPTSKSTDTLDEKIALLSLDGLNCHSKPKSKGKTSKKTQSGVCKLPKIDYKHNGQRKRKTSLSDKDKTKTVKEKRHTTMKKSGRSRSFDEVSRYSEGEYTDLSSTPTDIPTRTPEPVLFKEFSEFEKGFAKPLSPMRSNGSYQPRYCWCTRCQMMFNMYKADDDRLETWGNYPCFKF
ncbi:uncharacterized protein LOC134726225 [Mytilus trossulus]|uniref:uncharacterized protein LOC134726225 n=1 Tax=Mytilus trossulus TaxID=6551 RepID=UPI003003E727